MRPGRPINTAPWRPLDKTYVKAWLEKALNYGAQALALKPNDADALDLRGTTRYTQWFLNLAPGTTAAAKLVADAEQDLRASVASNPSQAHSWAVLSHMLMQKSNPRRGSSQRFGPTGRPVPDRGTGDLVSPVHQFAGSPDGVEANHWCEEGQQRFPTDPVLECQLLVLRCRDRSRISRRLGGSWTRMQTVFAH